jgi:hypothetical protein
MPMDKKQLDELILQLENHVECWKQFNHYVALARSKKFTEDDESQFLEIKSVLTQGLELIMSSIESGAPGREEIYNLISAAPSIRYLSELQENSLRAIENNWHKVFLAWQSILGQMKVQQQKAGGGGFFSSLFGKKKKK